MGACVSSNRCPAIIIKQPYNIPYLPGWDGPKCDSVGFFQHYGECWNDSLQMIILFTDGLKEMTQFIFFNTEITQKWVDDRIGEPAKGTRLSYYMFHYLRALQRRFKRHYATETAVRHLSKMQCDSSAEEMRKAKLGIELFYRDTGVDAIQSAIYGSFNPYANNISMTKYRRQKGHTLGSTIKEVDMLLAHIIKILGIEANVITKTEGAQSGTIIDAFMSPIPFPENLKAIRVHSGNHASAFYICGGKHYFYENNLGIIPFRWDKFLKASTYTGIHDFILAKHQMVPTIRNVKNSNSRAKTRKTRDNSRMATNIKQHYLNLEIMSLVATGNFQLVYAALHENNFSFAYYPFIRIKNSLDEVRFYTLSPTTGEPRFYLPAEVKYTESDLLAHSGIFFFPIYINSATEITNSNYNLSSSEIRASQRRAFRNNTYKNEYDKRYAVMKTFNATKYLTRKNKASK